MGGSLRLSESIIRFHPGNTHIFTSYSDGGGTTWSAVTAPTDRLPNVDRFNHWMSVDPVLALLV